VSSIRISLQPTRPSTYGRHHLLAVNKEVSRDAGISVNVIIEKHFRPVGMESFFVISACFGRRVCFGARGLRYLGFGDSAGGDGLIELSD
jgi:hypothetical protein